MVKSVYVEKQFFKKLRGHQLSLKGAFRPNTLLRESAFEFYETFFQLLLSKNLFIAIYNINTKHTLNHVWSHAFFSFSFNI